MSLRGTDVAAMMTRVETTLASAEHAPGGATGVLPVAPEGDAEVNVAVLRKSADIRIDFPPGSARPFVGPVVRLGKRTLRRAVAWYVTPMMEQQSRFNHAILDGIERLRVRTERHSSGAAGGAADTGPLPLIGGRAVAVGPEAAALADLLADDTDGRPEVLSGDPGEQLATLPPGSVDLVLCDVTVLGPAAVISALEASRAALARGATIVLCAADADASLRQSALEWALAATGFAAAPPASAGRDTGALAHRLARVDAIAREAHVMLVAHRGGSRA